MFELNNTAFDQGRRELGGDPGQIFFRGPYFKNFFGQQQNAPPPLRQLREKHFTDEYVVIAFQQLLPQFFTYHFSVLCPKNKYLALCSEIFHPKK
jgi:hypothetical protein